MDVLVRKCTVRHGTLLSVFCIVYLMNHWSIPDNVMDQLLTVYDLELNVKDD